MNIPRISIGTAGFANMYENITLDECSKIVNKAIIHKYSYFDTAPYYGNGQSEEILGKCLKNYSRDKFFISTKAGRIGNEFKYGYYDIIQSVMKSLKRLGIKYIDIVFIHDIECCKALNIILEESLPALKYLQNQGFVKYIGISGLYLNQLNYVSDNFKIDYILTYCCYTLINNSLTKYSDKWKEQNIKIIQGGVTSMGLLTPQGPPRWHPASYDIKAVCNKLNHFCSEKNINIVEKAFYYTYQNPNIDTILLGITSVNQLDQYIDWVNRLYCNNKIYINTLVEMSKLIHNKLWN
jgi:L-galactose dehydrogenase